MMKSEQNLYGSKGVVEYSAQSNAYDYTYMSIYDICTELKTLILQLKHTYVSDHSNMQFYYSRLRVILTKKATTQSDVVFYKYFA